METISLRSTTTHSMHWVTREGMTYGRLRPTNMVRPAIAMSSLAAHDWLRPPGDGVLGGDVNRHRVQ